jgi:hypothetical protein
VQLGLVLVVPSDQLYLSSSRGKESLLVKSIVVVLDILAGLSQLFTATPSYGTGAPIYELQNSHGNIIATKPNVGQATSNRERRLFQTSFGAAQLNDNMSNQPVPTLYVSNLEGKVKKNGKL